MKKIGFVDYYISEWHANNYPAWLREMCEKDGREYELSYVWAEREVSLLDGKTTAQWCEENGAEMCESIEELCEKSDAIFILSPSFPDKHLPYAEKVLPYGKPTYIDKSFTPDAATAEKIFAIAQKYGTPMFSSSALRYSTELDLLEGCKFIMTTGSGRSADEYIVHQAEMVVKKLGTGACGVRAEQIGDTVTFRVKYPDERVATMTFGDRYPFTVRMSNGADNAVWKRCDSQYFKALIGDILRFFEEKTPSFDPAQTLEVMKIREGAIRAEQLPDQWIEI